MKIEEVIHALEQFAPLPLQEDFDNAGLQVGLTWASDVSGALLCLDVTEAVVDEAIAKGCNLIVSHHPLIFHKLRSLTGADYVQRTIIKAIKNDVSIVSMHTNMDEALGGVNHKIAQKLGLEDLRFLGIGRRKPQDSPKAGAGRLALFWQDQGGRRRNRRRRRNRSMAKASLLPRIHGEGARRFRREMHPWQQAIRATCLQGGHLRRGWRVPVARRYRRRSGRFHHWRDALP